jgi:hypothetical protein
VTGQDLLEKLQAMSTEDLALPVYGWGLRGDFAIHKISIEAAPSGASCPLLLGRHVFVFKAIRLKPGI